MKKVLTIVIALTLIAGLFVIPSFAEDPTRVFTYETEGGVNVGLWTGNTDGRKDSHGVTFNAASDFVGLGLPQYWNSNGTNAPLVTYDFEIFNFDTDYETSVKGTPVFKQTVNPEGDAGEGIYFDFGKTLPKGIYTIRFKVTSDEGYTVLPVANTKNLYSNVRLSFTNDEPFAFYVDFTDSGLSNYFKKLPDAGDEIFEVAMYTGSGRDPHNLSEGPVAIVIDVPEGYALRELIGIQSPTWGFHESGSDAIVEVYKWDGDYDSSVGGAVLASGAVTDHADNNNASFKLDKDLPAGSYLAEFTLDGSEAIGFWCFTAVNEEGALSFQNGTEAKFWPDVHCKLIVVEPAATEPETEPAGEYTYNNASFDSFFVNDVLNFGKDDGAASDKLDEVDRTVDGSDGSVTKLVLRGWIGFAEEIESFGYQVNGKNVFGDFAATTEDAVKKAGGENASRFQIEIDASALKGTNKIVAVVKLTNGAIVKLDETLVATGPATPPNTSFTFIGVPEEVPATGDMTVAMFAVIAVLAMGAAVVFMKKRAF